MLNSYNILVVEDNPLVALDLAAAVEAAHGTVLGPFDTVSGALLFLESHSIDGAILDIELKDGNVTPLALVLLGLGIPMVFQSGQKLPDMLRDHQSCLPVFSKLVDRRLLVEKLQSLIQDDSTVTHRMP